MPPKSKLVRTHDDYTVAVVCALELEMSAVRFMLDHEHDDLPTDDADPLNYILGDLHGHNVVLTCLPGTQGKAAAAFVAAHLARSFRRTQWRFFVGIGGGVPTSKQDIRLGDVVVGMPDGKYGGVVQYDLGRDSEGGFHLTGFLMPPPTEVINAVGKMRASHRVGKNRIEEFLSAVMDKGQSEGWDIQEYERPHDDDILFEAGYSHQIKGSSCRTCDQTRRVQRPARRSTSPKIHYGLIASGDSVIKRSKRRDEVLEKVGEVLCFEMEAAGMMTESPCIVVRGISDYADSHKNDNWHGYAAATAAACTKELLSYL
ncbi:nucleoside phosphorylase domain-containing protein [Thelonectria olida]|uniref:Nucleoside phosphorylase domain-containing protein n=1 Tax=Thelonectria olida TaxID=1576542 RepID=A0A9P9AHS8_9HYPO|nr:nucleoside phosphorylase domain-containing protein [Thelonectria olida]